MQHDSALEFFESHPNPKARLDELKTKPETTQVGWEKEACSRHSPRPVQDDEQLIRAFDQPTHYRDGDILPAAFTDAGVRGLSCNRLQYISIEDAVSQSLNRVEQANARPDKPGAERKMVAYAIFSVAHLRSLMCGCPSRRGFGVYDTGLENDQSHADVCLLITDKQVERSLRSSLFAAAKQTLTLVEHTGL